MAAPVDDNVFGVFLEVRRQIRVVQVVLRVQRPQEDDDSRQEALKPLLRRLRVEVHPSSLHIISPPDGCRQVFPLAPVELLPKTCNGLHWVHGDGLHMRLQLAAECDNGGGDHDWKLREVEEVMEKEEVEYLSSSACVITCKVCGGKLATDPCIFDRVLPLPSENWREVAESWCCHGNDGTRQFARRSLQPLGTDCLVGNVYLLLHPSMLCRESLQLCATNGKRHGCAVGNNDKSWTLSLLCGRCRSSLGEAFTTVGDAGQDEDWTAVHSAKLFKHAIGVQSHGEDSKTNSVFRTYSTESYLARYLASVSQIQTTFKFILESDGHSKQPYILLWLLSADTLLLTSGAFVIGPSDGRFHGNQASPEPPEADGSEGDRGCEVKSDTKTHAVEGHRIVKLLYQTAWGEDGKRLLQQWSKDMSVHCISLPKATCLELILLLAGSNQHSPASMREMKGFKVGYLRR